MSNVRHVLKEQAFLLGLIGFISLVFLWQEVYGRGAYLDFMVIPWNVVIVWDSVLMGEFDFQGLLPVLSSAFLHGGIDHLIWNMIFLWIFGALAVELLGSRWMLITFIVTAICGSVLHVAMNAESSIPMLGASGAVMGFEGLYLAMAVRWYLPNPHVWPMAHPVPASRLAALGVIGMVMDYMGFLGGNLGVAYSAHLGGFIGGIVLGSFVVPMPSVAERR